MMDAADVLGLSLTVFIASAFGALVGNLLWQWCKREQNRVLMLRKMRETSERWLQEGAKQ